MPDIAQSVTNSLYLVPKRKLLSDFDLFFHLFKHLYDSARHCITLATYAADEQIALNLEPNYGELRESARLPQR
jgi:hypothetical protein